MEEILLQKKAHKKIDVGFENLRSNIKMYLAANPQTSILSISKQSKISHSSLYRFINKKSSLGTFVIEKLCKFFGMTISELFSSPSSFYEILKEKKKEQL
jgi:hypothetical protein